MSEKYTKKIDENTPVEKDLFYLDFPDGNFIYKGQVFIEINDKSRLLIKEIIYKLVTTIVFSVIVQYLKYYIGLNFESVFYRFHKNEYFRQNYYFIRFEDIFYLCQLSWTFIWSLTLLIIFIYYLLSIKVIKSETVRKIQISISKFFKICHQFVTKSGQGKVFDKVSENLVYEGNFSNNVRDGIGKYYTKHSGLSYVGNWKENNKEGFGELTEMIGNNCFLYRGNFKKGKKEGYGESFHKGTWNFKIRKAAFFPKENVIYRGCWRNDHKNGWGEEIQEKTELKYEGFFYNGTRHGFGLLMNDCNVKIYEGEWSFGKFHGFGKLYEIYIFEIEGIQVHSSYPMYMGGFRNSNILNNGRKQYKNGKISNIIDNWNKFPDSFSISYNAYGEIIKYNEKKSN